MIAAFVGHLWALLVTLENTQRMRTATIHVAQLKRVLGCAFIVLPHLDSHREFFLSDGYSGNGNNFP